MKGLKSHTPCDPMAVDGLVPLLRSLLHHHCSAVRCRFVMGTFYLVNHHDKDIQLNAWEACLTFAGCDSAVRNDPPTQQKTGRC